MRKQLVDAVVDLLPAREPVAWEDVVDSSNELSAQTPGGHQQGAVVGKLIGWTAEGEPLVQTKPEDPHALSARTCVPLGENDIGCNVVLIFEGVGAENPIILGILREPSRAPRTSEPLAKVDSTTLRIQLDDETLELHAQRQIVLRCGEASITLTRAGKVLIRGTYLVSRSSGMNRIKGGQVHIN